MTSPDLAIDLHRVEKIYSGRVHALRGIEMRVGRGEIFGLLGPNGAGKSTLVKIMMTVVHPTRADGRILGMPIGHKPTLARVGYLPENHRFPRYLTGRQVLEFFAALANLSRGERKRRSNELLHIVGMTIWADKKIGMYSKGMMQRIGLAQAMMNDPDLIVLDEPTDGVDPVGRREIRDVLTALKQRGTTVFINSHQLSELETVCDRVAILLGGTVARQGTLDELALGQERYEIQIAGHMNGDSNLAPLGSDRHPERYSAKDLAQSSRPDPSRSTAQDDSPMPKRVSAGDLDSILQSCAASGRKIERVNDTLRIDTIEPELIQPILDQLRQGGFTIRRVQAVRPTLEDLFMAAVQDHQRLAPSPSVSGQG